MLLFYIILAVLIGSIGSILASATLLLLSDKKLQTAASYLTSLAGGTLLGAAFLGMLPKAAETAPASTVFGLTLAGIILFFVLEKIIRWHSCYRKDCQRHKGTTAQLILLGDGLHNFMDGIAIAAAFMVSIPLGVVVTLSVFAHEVPQELADFGILIQHGYSRRRALFYNLLSGITALAGALLAWLSLGYLQDIIVWVLAFSAASFIYIALADLVPQMHDKTKLIDSLVQIGLILLGILIIYLFKQL